MHNFASQEPAKPLNNAQMCGSFFYIYDMALTIPFNKEYKSPQELVSILQHRGLEIDETTKAEHYLTHIGYYRLSAYMYPLLKMPKEQHVYKEGASFDKVMMLYRFDKKFRLFLFYCCPVNFFCVTKKAEFHVWSSASFCSPSMGIL